MISAAIKAVEAFIAAINQHSPSELSALMTEDHTFVDSGGRVESGRESMTAGWEDYFRMFPDYEIKVESILEDGNIVAARNMSIVLRHFILEFTVVPSHFYSALS